MKIDANRKIILEDFDQANRSVVQKLAQIINPFMEQVAQALTANLTRDNFKQQAWSFELPSGTTTRKVPWTLNEKPASVTIARLAAKSPTGTVTNAFNLTWTYGNGNIDLKFVGLAAQDHVATIIGQA